MATEMIAILQVTGSSITLSTTNSGDFEEQTDDNSSVAIYISVPVGILLLICLTVIAVVLIRRHKTRVMRHTESDPVYGGTDIPEKKRRSIPGIQNQAYSTYSVESKENKKLNSGKTNPSHGMYRKTSHDSITELPTLEYYQNINIQSNSNMSDIYMNDSFKDSTNDYKLTSYSYVTNAKGGFEVMGDVYSDVTFEDPTLINYNLGQCIQAREMNDTRTSLEEECSLYDHTNAARADPSVAKTDDILNTNSGRDTDERLRPARHSYVNVTNQDDHFQNTQNNVRNTYDHIDIADHSPQLNEEYSHLKGISETELTASPHKYENVIPEDKEGNKDPSTQRKYNSEYEDPVGKTPNYFLIEQ